MLAPSLALVTQTTEEWQVWGRGGLDVERVLAVCSDADGADFTTSADEVERFSPMLRRDHRQPFLGQHLFEGFQNTGLVIDDEDGGTAG